VTARDVVDRAALAGRLEKVVTRMRAAAERAGRDPAAVTLVAVSKAFPTDVILEGIGAGLTDFGENRAQELRAKVTTIGDRARWHFVGHLQTNKVRHVVGSVALVHSVDRYGVAEAIARRARSLGIVQEVLIEVNVAGERTKHGVAPDEAVALAAAADALVGVGVRGLMTMPPPARDPEQVRPYFRTLAELHGSLLQRVPRAGELSMGMSGDFEVAIEEGATIVRVGEAIFGPRR
jgi:pyridoxal phosphate enzyme (YggS family)